MNQKVGLQQTFTALLALLVVGAIALLVVNGGNLAAIPVALNLSLGEADVAPAEAFDYARAADVSAMRWEAMASYYEAQGLLTRDAFDYEQAAENVAYRWNAMAEAYRRNGLLDYRSNPDDVMAYRWNAMGEAYKSHGLLNYSADPDDVMAYRWQAMAREYERLGLLNDN